MIVNSTAGKFEFTFGADPEIFVRKDKALVSAHGLIKGDKKNPLKVKHGAVQVDGMALEFNIDPAKHLGEFNRNIDAVMGELKKMTPGYEFDISPVAEFGKDYIKKQPAEARVLGCDPDFNAYTERPNPVPDGDRGFRTASGHVHIGWKKQDDPNWPQAVDPHDPGHFAACCALTKVLDAYLGIYSIVWDDNIKRRELYGAPGAFRPKPYGMEYRVLSNAWLLQPHIRQFIFCNSLKAVADLFADPELPNKTYYGKTAQEIISTNDKALAMRVLKLRTIPSPVMYRDGKAELVGNNVVVKEWP